MAFSKVCTQFSLDLHPDYDNYSQVKAEGVNNFRSSSFHMTTISSNGCTHPVTLFAKQPARKRTRVEDDKL